MTTSSEQDSGLYIARDSYDHELVPALRNWQNILQDLGVESHLWFLFGSVVKQTELDTESDPVTILARELLGIRGPGSRPFRAESDIDTGLVVGDGNDEIDLSLNELGSTFSMTKIAGHVLSLTRFTTSWVDRRGTSVEEMRNGTTKTLGFYGRIIIVTL